MWSFFIFKLSYICTMKKNIHIIITSLVFAVILWASVSLSNDYYSTIKLPVRLNNFPDGFTSGTKLPDEISIRLKGQGWKLLSVSLTGDIEYVIPVGSDSGRKFVNLHNFVTDNPWISSDVQIIDIIPDTLSFLVERIESKKVAVLPDIELEFKLNFGLANPISIYPDSVTVFGPRSTIKNLRAVLTEQKIIKDLDKAIIERVNLIEMPGVNYDKNFVTANLDVQRIVDKNIDELLVEVLNVPNDRDVVLLPNKIGISVRGGIEILGRLTPEDFRPYVQYRDIVLDTLGNIHPVIEVPENITIISTKPERLRYIIKKF
jgi:hypothetical protein